ncbi:MAG: hypothetical protein ACOZFS_06125 [Thermodesulfobacteriota bacterium]
MNLQKVYGPKTAFRLVLFAVSLSVFSGAALATESPIFAQPGETLPYSQTSVGPGAPGDGSNYSQYNFAYNYNDGSGDQYYGYVFAPTAFKTTGPFLQVGTKLYNQPQEMGGSSLGGYYEITAINDGYDSTYDHQSYISSYYDGDTGKTSYTLYSTTGSSTATNSLYVADRRYAEESGYVYDPGVPESDDYFGNADICYDFSAASSNDNNFLVQYIPDLSYWAQPTAYPNCCVEVAGALILSYWDQYVNLIDTDWQSLWPDNTSDSPTSYGALIGTLANYMGYPISGNGGTYVQNCGPGLDSYAADRGYSGFQYVNYDFRDVNNTESYRTTIWQYFTDAIDTGRPVGISIYYYNGGDNDHFVTGRGYWNDGQILVNMGWGTSYTNYALDWFRTNYNGTSYYDAYIYYFVDFYYSAQ